MTDTAHRIVSTSILQGIANAIRSKTGGSSPIAVEDFASEIANIPTGGGGNPAGVILVYAGSTAPTGYLLCDGSAVSRTTYATLFSVIGTTYGSGDDSTTFNLPDLSGKVALGASVSHALGTSGGEESHTLITNELPSHTHEVPQHGHTDDIAIETPTLTHSVTQASYSYTHATSTVKVMTASNGTAAYTSSAAATASRTADATVSNHSPAVCTKTGGVEDCLAFDTVATGSGTAHNNMQPFQTLNYIISTGD